MVKHIIAEKKDVNGKVIYHKTDLITLLKVINEHNTNPIPQNLIYLLHSFVYFQNHKSNEQFGGAIFN